MLFFFCVKRSCWWPAGSAISWCQHPSADVPEAQRLRVVVAASRLGVVSVDMSVCLFVCLITVCRWSRNVNIWIRKIGLMSNTFRTECEDPPSGPWGDDQLVCSAVIQLKQVITYIKLFLYRFNTSILFRSPFYI